MISTISSAVFDPRSQNRDWYYESIKNHDNLLITVGDSWTWGNYLGNITQEKIDKGVDLDDFDYRISHVYGTVLANKLDSDFVNFGICGFANIDLIYKVEDFIKNIHKPYKKIQIVLTLTESGRELSPTFLFQYADTYQELKGFDWPTFDDLIQYNASDKQVDQVIKECIDIDCLLYRDLQLHYALKGSTNIVELLSRYEEFTFKLIASKFSNLNVDYIVGRNFTNTFNNNKSTVPMLDKNWINVISEQGTLTRPNPTYLVSFGFAYMLRYLKRFHPSIFANKLDVVKQIESSINLLNWNEENKKTKLITEKGYPLEQAHQWWADYIFNQLETI